MQLSPLEFKAMFDREYAHVLDGLEESPGIKESFFLMYQDGNRPVSLIVTNTHEIITRLHAVCERDKTADIIYMHKKIGAGHVTDTDKPESYKQLTSLQLALMAYHNGEQIRHETFFPHPY